MKHIGLFWILVLAICFNSKAQTTRYFEFRTTCGHGNWQDTTFVASVSNQTIIDTVLANLARPINQRQFIAGPIDAGDGGHNHNATHWFLWHFIPNQWSLVDLAIEVCDGCPYSDLDANPSYWLDTIGQFCPWSGQPVREVSKPAGIDQEIIDGEMVLFPNPAKDKFYLEWNGLNNVSVTILNSIGQECSTYLVTKQNSNIDIADLANGIYFLRIVDRNKIRVLKFIVEGK